MNIVSMILGGALALLLVGFLLRLSYTIIKNLINGQKFHQSLEREFNHLRLSNMLTALGINKTAFIYQTRTSDIQQQMNDCMACTNTGECDEILSTKKLSTEGVELSEIAFCNNEAKLAAIKQEQA